jgi:hypothetical protein
MKFVHMTSGKNASSIRRRGILMGNGRFGRGVYCMPMVNLSGVSVAGSENEFGPLVMRTKHQWKFLNKKKAGGHGSRDLCCIFDLGKRQVEIDIYLSCPKREVSPFFYRLEQLLEDRELRLHDDSKDSMDELGNDAPYACGLGLRAKSPKSVSLLCGEYMNPVGLDAFSDDFEAVVRSPVRRNEVVKLEAFYMTNKIRKSKKPYD